MRNVFIIGSKGIPAKYGGFETFVDKLTEKKINKNIKYHVSCLSNNNEEFIYNGARCFNVNVPSIGAAKAVYYDIEALKICIKYIEENKINNAIVYILACRIGPFISIYKKKLKDLGVKIFVNPDGHEWKRSKWNYLIKKYWKMSEKLMVKHADLLICDSKGIQEYISKEYKKFNPKTTFIPYGADVKKSKMNSGDKKLVKWYEKFNVKIKEYYLIVGRFVPENNYKTMIREFIASDSKKDLVIITNIEKSKFYENLLQTTNFKSDKRIKFVGTVYNSELLKKIRENAYAYIHGHEVGGTNPSLLEALASTQLNLLLNVNFNKEVAQDGATYFNKENNNLKNIINEVEKFSINKIVELETKSRLRIKDFYSWKKIVIMYEQIFE